MSSGCPAITPVDASALSRVLQPPLPAWRHPYAFRSASAFFADAWPAAWQAAAAPQILLPLDATTTHALGAQILGAQRLFAPADPRPLVALRRQIDAALLTFENCGFIRLSSRSPKDSLRAARQGLRVTNGSQALAMILEGSIRCAQDLRMSLDCQLPLSLVLRPWLTFEPWRELRVVMIDHAFAGASARANLTRPQQDCLRVTAVPLLSMLRSAVERLGGASPRANAVFELLLPDPLVEDADLLLLDANPLGPSTGMGLFESAAALDGSLRV